MIPIKRKKQVDSGVPAVYLDWKTMMGDTMTNGQHLLTYRTPARCWDEALPVGNGRIGAMIFGRVAEELVELNEDTLWSGRPRHLDDDGYFDKLQEARALLRQKKLHEADEFISRRMLHCDSQGYLTAGRLRLTFAGDGAGEGYRRGLDLADAVCSNRTDSRRCEWFASAPHQVLVMRCSAAAKGGTAFSLSLDTPLVYETGTDGADLFLNGTCPVHARRDLIVQTDDAGRSGVRFQIRVRVLAEGGSVSAGGGRIAVSGADSAVLLLAIRSDFAGWDRDPAGEFPAALCRADLDRAAAAGYDALLAAHLGEYRSLYLRSSLELPESPGDSLPTDERLRNCRDTFPPALAALLYHFGRYLLIASSRPGTQPANLQGIWSPYLLAPWASNYTTNINLEMNYWAALPANLAECAEPLLRFVREAAESGRETARRLYHARGWCMHHNSDLWRYTFPAQGQARWGFWPLGGLWVCRHLCEYFHFTGDTAFLREFYPVLRGGVEFALDLLVENERGELVISPSTSPENGFIDPANGKVTTVCGNGSAMDLELVRESFEHVIEAAETLGEEDPLIPELKAALARLRPLAIGGGGQLLEYDENYEEAEPRHRHLSHLYGVYPGEFFTPDRNPELYEAARVSLIRRGDRSTGWAMCWRLALWARFRNGEHAKSILKEFLTFIDPTAGLSYDGGGGIYPNLFSAHPPFQIDANLGVPAAIVELFVQSHRKTLDGVTIIDLLPALPPGWEEGRLTGVRARSGVFLDLEWKGGRVSRLSLRASHPVAVELRGTAFDGRVQVGPGGLVLPACR